jgi:Fe-S cluster biogenesis protein NfuA
LYHIVESKSHPVARAFRLDPARKPYYINLRGASMPDLESVKKAIQDVRPSLQADGGDIELLSVSEDGKVSVKLKGACGSCPMAIITLKQGVEAYLKKVVPGVTEVVQG